MNQSQSDKKVSRNRSYKAIITSTAIIWAGIVLQAFCIPLILLLLVFYGISFLSITLLLGSVFALWFSISHLKLIKAYQQRLSSLDTMEKKL